MRESVDKVNRLGRQDPANDEVLELVHRVMHQFRSQLFQALRQGQHELTHMESKVLGFYAHRPGATQSDLVQHTGRDKAQLARLIKGLRERGLLHGEADAADRRNVRLQLTAEGQAIQRALRGQAKALEAQAVVGLAEEERAQLLALLRRVQDNLGG
ncbi:MAG: MarR family transcriptional regulator [Variovorax paradoxus]|jgi:DNA-binding MarR family transcriptional regulator|nr:MAG: MarR family transcriptional regulator [Variovorax paradoxus]PZQ17514.1 MAG: MarR family transcriptional regulator [Variovorax paradoxus]